MPPAQPRKEREIESWLGDLRGAGDSSGAGPAAPAPPLAPPPRASAQPTRTLSDQGSGASAPTTAIPAAKPVKPVKPVKPDPRTADPRTPDPRAPGDDSAAATRAIPTQRKSDADAATDKLNAPAEDEPQRRGTSGLSAQDLLRREGRLK